MKVRIVYSRKFVYSESQITKIKLQPKGSINQFHCEYKSSCYLGNMQVSCTVVLVHVITTAPINVMTIPPREGGSSCIFDMFMRVHASAVDHV